MTRPAICSIPCAILSIIALVSSQEATSQSLSDAVDIRVICASTARIPTLKITVSNRGGEDVAILVGSVVANERYLGYSVSVETRDREGARIFTYSDPSISAIAGNIDPWVLPLSSDVSFVLTWPFDHFIEEGLRLSDKPEPYELRVAIDAVSPPNGAGYNGYRPVVGLQRSEWISIPGNCTVA